MIKVEATEEASISFNRWPRKVSPFRGSSGLGLPMREDSPAARTRAITWVLTALNLPQGLSGSCRAERSIRRQRNRDERILRIAQNDEVWSGVDNVARVA